MTKGRFKKTHKNHYHRKRHHSKINIHRHQRASRRSRGGGRKYAIQKNRKQAAKLQLLLTLVSSGIKIGKRMNNDKRQELFDLIKKRARGLI